MKCPKCKSPEVWRDSVDVGVGIMHGPYGCSDCGWSEDERYDQSEGSKYESGCLTDQWGGLHPMFKSIEENEKEIEERRLDPDEED